MQYSLTSRNSTFCVKSEIDFLCISVRTAIISLCRITWLVVITETGSAHFAVRTECLYTDQFNLNFYVGY
jgi:hypothetical protein